MFVLEKVIQLFAPHDCLGCGSEGSLLCEVCLQTCVSYTPHECFRCGTAATMSAACDVCLKSLPLASIHSRTGFTEMARDLVHALKFGRAQAAAATIATLLAQVVPTDLGDYVVVHVPTANSRRRQRGYDHAELIAKELARVLDCRHLPLIVRHGSSRQVGASRSARLTQLQNSFAVLPTRLSRQTPILLVDDVITTGASICSAAMALRAAGFQTVHAATFAQTTTTYN